MTSIPPIRVDIVAGDNTAVPELQRTGAEIARVAAGANGGLSPIQRLSKAMVLAEGREGSLVLRELRSSIGTLAGEAVGATGGLGRLGASLGEFAIGGATGLAVVAGIAAIGYAWKKEDEAAQLAADNAVSAADRMHRVFASVMKQHTDDPAEGIKDLQKAVAEANAEISILQASPLPAPRMETLAEIGGIVPVAINDPAQERSDQMAVLANKASAAQQAVNDALNAANEAGDRAADSLKRQAAAEQAAVAIREHAIETGQDETKTLIQLAGAAASAQAAVMGLDAAHTTSLVAAARRLERLKEENKTLEAQRDLIVQIDQIASDVSGFFAQPFQQEILAAIKVPTLAEILGQERLRQAGLRVAELEKQGGQFAFDTFDQRFFDHVQAGVSDALATTPGKGSQGLGVASEIGGESVALLGALKGGGLAGILGAGGGLATTLGHLTDKEGASLLPSFVPGLGLGLNLASGIVGLFDNSAERRHKEMLAALKKIEEKAVPVAAQVRPIFVGATPANAGQVSYDVGRFQDRDGVYRGVGES